MRAVLLSRDGAMKNQRLPLLLFGGGVALIIVAIFWSLYAYGQVGGLVAGKGLRPNQVFVCLFGPFERCAPLAAAHAERGTWAYSPWAFWLGAAGILTSFALNL